MGSVRLLKASAGSGKTFRLAYEYVRAVVAEPMQYRHILAVTFTNKATEEMKRRIVKEINDLARGERTQYLLMLEADTKLPADVIASRALLARTRILHDYSHFAILTIDKFFQRIIRSFIKELGVDINFNLELQTDSLLSSAADAVIDEIPANDELRQWITAFVEERIGENKKWEIKSGLAKLGGEIFREHYKLMSASRITRDKLDAIVGRVSAKASPIMDTMKKYAVEALGIMAANGLDYTDFSGGKGSFANYFNKIAAGEIAAYGARVVNALESDEKWYARTSPKKEEIMAVIPELRPLLEKICSMYDAEHRFLNSAALLRGNYRNFALLTDLAEKLEDICASEGIIPISETNDLLYKLVSGNDAPFIFEKAGNHFHRFMIDEFQDTSSMQWKNFVPLLHNALSQSETDAVLLVGDVKQSIYRWRGGDWRILASEIEREFGQIISEDLTANYRSMRNIVDFNNDITGNIVDADNDYLNGLLEEAFSSGGISGGAYGQLRDMLRNAYSAHRQQAARETREGYVNVTYYGLNDDDELIPPVVRRIEELQERGYAAGDIAVLVRLNSQGVAVSDMLLERKRSSPGSRYSYDVVTQEALLISSSPAVLFVVACLKLSASDDPLAAAIYNRRLGHPFHRKFTDGEVSFFRELRLKSTLEAFGDILMRFRLNADPDNIAYLQAFEEQIINFSNSGVGDTPLFVKWWEENGADKSVNVPLNRSSITITSIHKAKGLQYKAVIIPYCDWSLAPRPNSVVWTEGGSGDGDFAELGPIPAGYSDRMRDSVFAADYYRELVLSHVDNINTFYVAVTRAVEELHIMIPATSTGRYKSGRISTLVTDAVAMMGDSASSSDTDAEGNHTVSFGEPLIRHGGGGGEVAHEEIIHSRYNTYAAEGRLRLRMPSQRYVEEGGEARLSPRDYGILMHKVFESAENKDEVGKAINSLAAAGDISAGEAARLYDIVERAFADPLISSWFGGEWESVRNESDIIVPGDPTLRRPDRVMVKGRQAVVVDYKFGLGRPASHRRQMRRYMELLGQMEYEEVEGYLWYISLDDIEPVSLR